MYNLVSTGGQDPYLAKLDAAGNFVCAINTGFSVNSLHIDNNNTVYLAGSFNDTTDFNPNATQVFNVIPIGATDIYIAKSWDSIDAANRKVLDYVKLSLDDVTEKKYIPKNKRVLPKQNL